MLNAFFSGLCLTRLARFTEKSGTCSCYALFLPTHRLLHGADSLGRFPAYLINNRPTALARFYDPLWALGYIGRFFSPIGSATRTLHFHLAFRLCALLILFRLSAHHRAKNWPERPSSRSPAFPRA